MNLERAIRDVQAFVFRCPIRVPVRTSFGVMHERPAVLIRVEDEDGAVGWGEAWCNFPSVGAEHRARLVNELLAPRLLGKTFASPREVFADLTGATAVLALQSGEHGPIAQAIAGLDIALWDLAAQRARKPLYALLGGAEPRIPVYASGINPDRPQATVEHMRAKGHRAFKLKVGFDDVIDERNLRSLRELIGPDLILAADANQAWDIERATKMVQRFAPFGLRWIEEPLRVDRPRSEWRALRSATEIPIAGGENVAGVRHFADALGEDIFSVVQPDAAKWGGITGCLEVAAMIREKGAVYCPHYLGGGIGLLASAHLLAAAGGEGLLEVDVNENALRDELCGPLAKIEDGRATLSAEPGLGVVPNLKLLRRYEVRSQRVASRSQAGWRRALSDTVKKTPLAKIPFERLDPVPHIKAFADFLAPNRYEPARYYMRGPGPKTAAARAEGDGEAGVG